MRRLTFWFDPISPYAHLAFFRLPEVLAGHSVVVDYKPALFGALLKHHAHKGPAEIEPKRAWTFRQVAWLGHRMGIRIDLPAQHPFNPLPLHRLMLAAAPAELAGGLPNRRVVERVFRHVWEGGLDPVDPGRLAALAESLATPERPLADPNSPEVKARLRHLTDEAIERGVFGVPTVELDGRLYWGLDALEMVRADLDGDPWLAAEWERAARRVPGVERPA